MNCETYEARLNELLDDRVPLDLDEGLREHHERCRECRLLFASYSELVHAVSFRPPLQPDAALTDKIVAASLRRDSTEHAELIPERRGHIGAGRWVRVSQVVATVAAVSAVVLAMLAWNTGHPVGHPTRVLPIAESKDGGFSDMARDYTNCWAELARETRNELADVSSLAPRLDDAKRKQVFVVCLAGIALLSASLFLWAWTADVQQRYGSLGEGILYNFNPRMLIDSLSARNAFWAAGWEAFSEHPVLGIGLGRFRTSDYIMSRIGRFRHAHNSFLNIAAELGLLGFGLWGALLCRWYVQVWRRFRSTEDPVEASLLHGLLLGVSGFLVTALADDPLFYSEGQVVFWFVLGIGGTSFATAQRSPRMGVLLAGV